MKIGKGFIVSLILILSVSVLLKTSWMIQYSMQEGEDIPYDFTLSFNSPNNESVETFLLNDPAGISYAQRVYGYTGAVDVNFSRELLIFVTYFADTRDGFGILGVKLLGGTLTVNIRYDDVGFPRNTEGIRITLILTIKLADLGSSQVVDAGANVYVDNNTVFFQMLVVLDLLILVRTIYLVAKKRDLTFRSAISFLTM